MRIGLIAICLLWVITAFGLMISKRMIVDNGAAVLLKTLPASPQDRIQGDHLVLRYEINSIPLDKSAVKTDLYKPGQVVYVALKQQDAFWRVESIQSARPGAAAHNDVFIRSVVKDNSGTALDVEYGIERVFVPEDDVWRFEQRRQDGKDNTLDVEARVGKDGRAIIAKIFVNGAKIDF